MGIISHMGRNTDCGHYVAHVKKGDRWVLFNDEKVMLSLPQCGLYLVSLRIVRLGVLFLSLIFAFVVTRSVICYRWQSPRQLLSSMASCIFSLARMTEH